MQNLLFNLLQPTLSSMGVSDADLSMYLGQCMPYVYVILATLVVAIVVIVVATLKAKKGTKHVINWSAALAWVLAVLVVVNIICYGPLQTTLNTFLSGAGIELQDSTVQASKDVIQKVGEEGIVLVKNDGLLPLSSDVKNLNVFGWDSTNPLFGGTGSGSSDGSSAVGILASLQNAGYSTNEELTKIYTDYTTIRPTIAMGTQDWTLPEPTVDVYTDAVMSNAKSFSDVAVIVIGRSGGEGADLPTDMYAVIHGTYDVAADPDIYTTDSYGYTSATYTNNGSYDDFDEGETYLELSNTEEAMVEKVCSEFDNVIVIINANNTMELGWVDEYEQIGAVILAPGAGATGFTALGEIINGSVNPSGKTVDTFVKDLTAAPYFNNIGNFSYNNVDDLKKAIVAIDSSSEGNMAFANYVEGIYVGYKFYETAAEEGLIDYDEYVQYPFGYGLSYTTFTQEISNFADNGDEISFDVTVTNTGNVAGKDVVEVYFNPPYTNGGIEKASVNLVQFAKTDLLEAGKSQVISFTIAKEDMASYDSEGIKIDGGGYILEAGEYVVSVRSDSHTVLDEVSFTVSADIDYSTTGRASDQTAATNEFEDYARGDFVQLSRADKFANYAEATAAPSQDAYVMSDEVRAAVESNSVAGYDGSLYDNASDTMPTMGANNGLTLYELRGLDYDDAKWDTLLDQLTYTDMSTLITYGGWSTQAIDSVGKVSTADCDGPAGLSNFMTGAYGTAYPAEVLMAQTWNTELMEEMGEAVGQEYADANNYGWYGPAMNTHRSAFAGRNFEYYSEDGVLSGYMAAAEINGAQKMGLYPYIKHFAVNDQETNRCSFLLTFASEQALREIYLKPFELAVKNYEGTALAVMSSFNWIGTEPSVANSHLLLNVLRGEWGFKGFVCSDYDGSYGYMIGENGVRSGNDLFLGFGNMTNPAMPNVLPFGSDGSESAASATLVQAMRQSCKNILYTVVNSGYYADGNPVGGGSALDALFVKVNVVGGIVIVGLELIVLIPFFMKKKGKKAAK